MHLVAGAAGTWLARRYALRRALIDHPGERRSHTMPTPRGGGVGIVAALLLALAWLGWTMPAARTLFTLMGLGLGLVAGIGWADDHRPLPASLRLLVHAIAAALLGGALLAHGMSPWLAACTAALALVLVNVWNFMDGINGLAASQAALVALGWVLWAGGGAAGWLAAALMAGLLGFLPFNFPNARVFLGDVGSGAIGFALACGAGLAWRQLPEAPTAMLVLPLATFGVDAALTLLSRILNKEPWWEAHVSHAYQRWARRAGHVPVTLAYGAWTGAGLVMMLNLPSSRGWSAMVAGVYLGMSAAIWWKLRSNGVQAVGGGE